MRVVIQRVSESTLQIDGRVQASIGAGLVVLLGIGHDDNATDTEWLCAKICNLRVFPDSSGVMNLSVKEIGGELLLVSQFTLHASTKKGNRPSYIAAAPPDKAMPIYESVIAKLETSLGKKIQTGVFGAEMKIQLVNDGPVTIVIDTKSRE